MIDERHAENGIEPDRTACGLVLLDRVETGGVVVLAGPGNVVTCLQCRQIIADAQALYTGNFRRRGSPLAKARALRWKENQTARSAHTAEQRAGRGCEKADSAGGNESG